MTDWKATAKQLHEIATFFFHSHFDSSLRNDDALFEKYVDFNQDEKNFRKFLTKAK